MPTLKLLVSEKTPFLRFLLLGPQRKAKITITR
jgi:hypothetical protein